MKTFFKRLGWGLLGLVGLGLIVAVTVYASRPWYSRWGATDDEVQATFPGDELVPSPRTISTKAVTIKARPAQIYPWLLQMGADKGGWYSHTFIEGLLQCPIVNADRLHPEWQTVNVGDPVRMCPGEAGPPPYIVAAFEKEQYMIWGHRAADGTWNDIYQFVLLPTGAAETRLILRSRSNSVGWIWDVLEPGFCLMESGMLQGIQQRAEALAQPVVTGSLP